MKRTLLRTLFCLLLALCLLPALPARAAEEVVDGWTVTLADGAELVRTSWWTGGDYRTEHSLILAPGAALRPVAVTGEALRSTGTVQEAAARLEERGLHAVAGVNGGYYNMSELTPVGLVVSEGVLRASAADGAWMTALGFRADGTTVIGKSAESLSLTVGGRTLPVEALNQVRGAGLTVYTPDYDPSGATETRGWGWTVVCAAAGPIPLSGEVGLRVESVVSGKEPVTVPEGCLALSLAAEDEDDPAPAWLSALRRGDKLTLTVDCDPAWEDVESAVALLYPLVEGGAVCEKLDKNAQPRTAAGLRADGTLVLCTVDGRQSGHSLGMSLEALARRMLALGCVEAATLDGGASTALSAALPGESALGLVSSPSLGHTRDVTSYILLATEAKPTGKAARLGVGPRSIHALAGAEIVLTAGAADANGQPAPLPEGLQWTVSDGLGAVEDGVLRCGTTGGSGVLTLSAPGAESCAVPLTVVESPEELALYGEVYGRKTESLTLGPEQEVDLTVQARSGHVLLTGGDECYEWSLESAAGTVDGTGHITPAKASGEGALTVRAGETEISIPIKIWTGVPFSDVAVTDDCFEAVRYVYEHQLFQGTGRTSFSPEVVMDRAMLVTVLWRMNGAPEDAPRPGYGDVDPASWYGPAVAWATDTGLVKGYSPERFGPTDDLTKEQILTILSRYAALQAAAEEDGEDAPPEDAIADPAPATDLAGYADGDAVGDWAREAVAWALRLALIDPDGEGRLQPQTPMTRAAVAEVLMRYEIS